MISDRTGSSLKMSSCLIHKSLSCRQIEVVLPPKVSIIFAPASKISICNMSRENPFLSNKHSQFCMIKSIPAEAKNIDAVNTYPFLSNSVPNIKYDCLAINVNRL